MSLMESEWTRLAWAQAWQVAVLAAAVALLARLVARNRPHLAHALWLVVILKCLTPPFWSSPCGLFCWMQPGRAPPPSNEQPECPDLSPDGTEGDVEFGAAEYELPSEFWAAAPEELPQVEVAVVARPVEAVATQGTDRQDADEAGASVPVAPRTSWGWPLAAIWLAGTTLIVAVAAVRWAACWRRVKRSHCRTDPSYDELLGRLARRLRLRRRVRLVVSDSPVGPAVIGLFRPTVLLPNAIADAKSPADLEPILAHELIHVRRGDLWLSALQTVAQAVWWFHPLVWWAGRRLAREAELCCDEAVVAELRCRPARYARSLLEVLKRKRSLQPVPAFPGVRPVEVTSKRMERIMRLGQGCRKRTPWWCWALMLVAAAAALPGAAFVVAADESKAEQAPPVPAVRPWQDLTAPPATVARTVKANTPGDAETTRQSTRVYGVADLLAALHTQCRLDVKQAKEHVLGVADSSAAMSAGGQPTHRLAWFGDDLVARATERQHEQIGAALETMRKHGGEPIVIRVRFITGPAVSTDVVKAEWKPLPAEVKAAEGVDGVLEIARGSIDRPLPGEQTPPRGEAKVVVERNLPVVFDVLDRRRAAELIDQVVSERRTNCLSSPTVMVFNGQTAAVCNTSQSPFVVSVHEGKPVIRVLSEGMQVRLRPLLRDEQKVWLDCQLTLSRIGKVDTFTFAGEGGHTIQLPEYETTRVDTSMELPLGQTLAIGGLTTEHGQDETQPLLVLLELTRAPRKGVAGKGAQSQPRLVTRNYDVADLVVPIQQELDVAATPAGAPNAPARPDFEPLVDLITTTIAPHSWGGGRGAIRRFEANLSVVIRQTEEVHEEIAGLLEQLRRLYDVEVMLVTETFDLPGDMLRKAEGDLGFKLDKGSAELSVQQARRLRESLRASKDVYSSTHPKVTLFNGQLARIPLIRPGRKAIQAGRLRLQGVIANDRRSVRVSCAIAEAAGTDPPGCFDCVVGDGNTVLFDATDRLPWAPGQQGVPMLEKPPHVNRLFQAKTAAEGDRKTLIVVTPRIIIQEEAEERLGIAPPKQEQPRTQGRLILGGVEPRVIIQEEEEERLGIPEP